VGVNGVEPGTCRKGCSASGECRGPAYTCRDVDDDGTTECWVLGSNGEPCTADAQCAGGTCKSWPRGYCVEACPAQTCAFGGHCAALSEGPFCVADCPGCRAGYSCTDIDLASPSECVPGACTGNDGCTAAAPVCEIGTGQCIGCQVPSDCSLYPGEPACNMATGACEAARPNGEACQAAGECAGGTCMTSWPDGYCTETCDPVNSPSCGAGGLCEYVVGGAMCMAQCTPGVPPDCRSQYTCMPETAGANYFCAVQP
jgi:hypothetical protein